MKGITYMNAAVVFQSVAAPSRPNILSDIELTVASICPPKMRIRRFNIPFGKVWLSTRKVAAEFIFGGY
jgi:hypothetical protein